MSSSFSRKQISKKSSPSSNSNLKTNLKTISKNILTKQNDQSLPHFNTLDSSFLKTMEQLVSNDKTIREKAAQETKKYLLTSYSNSEELYQKISRSLFYFFWNTDKSMYQLSMAKIIASYIYINPDDKNKLIPKNKLWISTFLSEMSKKFQNIDSLRLDKYIMMIDQVMSTYLNACLENKFFKSVIYLINYFIKESENKNNFNFTFEANKIKVLSRFIKLILNSDEKIEGNIKNKDEFLNNEESGFATFYKKLLIFYKNMKDKREIKNFQENILETIINSLIQNKKEKKNLNLIHKIEEINENFIKENKNDISANKSLNMEFFLNKLKNENNDKNIIENYNNKNKNVVDPVNDYIMKKKYLQKFKKPKEDIKKEKIEKEKKEKNKNLMNNENVEKNKNDEDVIVINKEKSDKKKKSEKKEKLDILNNISKELNFDNIENEKEIIDLNEENEENKETENNKELNEKKDDVQSLKNNEKNEDNSIKNKKDISNKKDSGNKKEKIKNIEQDSKQISKNNTPKKTHQKNPSSSGDDDCLIEDSDESESVEELLEENDDDDSSENPSSQNNSSTKEKNKSSLGDLYTDEALDKYSKELMEEEEEEDEDEEYEMDENDLDILADEMNLMLGKNYNDKRTLENTKLNMKQSLLNKKTMRNIKNEMKNNINNLNKNKKKKISFSLENNVLSLYNSKIPISLKSKKKNVFVPGIINKQSILKK